MVSGDNRLARLVHKLDPRSNLLRAWTLRGGVSARVTALEVQHPDGRTAKWVVRQHGDADLRQNPHIAADEFRLLQVAHAAGLAVPQPYYLDQSGEVFPTPYVVVEYVEGQPELAPSDITDLI